jgi:CubicO group peptidase (beta-lactamase class C family)
MNMLLKRTGAALVLATAMYATPVAVLAQANIARLDSFMNHVSQHNKMMGSVAISKGGKVVFNKAIGEERITNGKAVHATTATRYRVGSVTKMFTAVLVFQQIEAGKLTLDSKLETWFPGVPNAGKITIGNLLNHHSGLFNVTNDPTYVDWNTKPVSREDMVKKLEALKIEFEPGKEGEYSNSNYILLGFILEKITGKPYADLLKENITGKLGLKNTSFAGQPDPKKHDAMSYSYDSKKWVEREVTDMSIPQGAGAVVSTPADLVKFETGVFTGKLVSKNSLNQMMDLKDGYGMGLFRFPWTDRWAWGHTGGIDGFSSMLSYFPDDSVCIALTSNGVNFPVNDVMIGLLSIYYDMPYMFPSFIKFEVPPSLLKAYAGTYSSAQIPIKLTITEHDGALSAQATGQSAFPLEAVSREEFKFDAAGLRITFSMLDAVKASGLVLKQGGQEFTFTKD